MKLQTYFTVTSYGSPDKGIVFMFGGWRFRKIWYQPGIRLLTKLGYQTILFVPKSNLISAHTPVEQLKRAAEAAQRVVDQYLEMVRDAEELEVITMAVSLGTLFGAYSAIHTPAISKVILTSPFGDFQDHVERWQEERFSRKVIRRQPGGVARTIATLSSIVSVEEMARLDDKKLFIYYSDNDHIVHTEVTEAMIDELEASGLKPEVIKVKGGHQTGVFRSYAHVMKSRRFIEN